MCGNSRPIEPRGTFISGCQHGPVDAACRNIGRTLARLLRPGMFRRVQITTWGSPDGRFDAWRAMWWSRVMPLYGSADLEQAEAVEQFAIDRALDFTAGWADTLDINRIKHPRAPGAPFHYVLSGPVA